MERLRYRAEFLGAVGNAQRGQYWSMVNRACFRFRDTLSISLYPSIQRLDKMYLTKPCRGVEIQNVTRYTGINRSLNDFLTVELFSSRKGQFF